MKLSEVLKEDWPEKKEIDESMRHTGRIDDDLAFNTALTSCDREVDREALLSALNDYVYSSRPCEEGCDKFISTMPTWLKPTERK